MITYPRYLSSCLPSGFRFSTFLFFFFWSGTGTADNIPGHGILAGLRLRDDLSVSVGFPERQRVRPADRGVGGGRRAAL